MPLDALAEEARACRRCVQLAQTRTQVVFGSGPPDAELFLVAEAPRRTDDLQGVPLAASAGDLLAELLAGVGLTREQVFLTTVVKCRPPDNRDPLPQEVANCQDYLVRQLGVIQPKVVGALGNFATKLLRGDTTPVTRIHGQAEERVIGGHAVRLLPLFDPAAALYAKNLLATLRADMAQLPSLLALDPPDQPAPPPPPPPPPPDPDEPDEPQLGLF